MHYKRKIDPGQEINWGKTSTDYAQYRTGYPESFYERLKKLGIGLPKQRILDLGTGTGVLAREFSSYGCEVTGIDISVGQIETALILPKLLVVTRSCDENGKMKVDYYLSNANPDTPLEELARVPRLDPDKYTERRKINQQVSHTGKIQHFHELLPQERERRVTAILQQSMQARQLQAVAIKLLPGLPQPKAFVVDVEPETEVTNTTARHKLFGTLRPHSQYQNTVFSVQNSLLALQ